MEYTAKGKTAKKEGVGRVYFKSPLNLRLSWLWTLSLAGINLTRARMECSSEVARERRLALAQATYSLPTIALLDDVPSGLNGETKSTSSALSAEADLL
jgi:ABC-type branched-subunit amino acid transport system ATPase component